MAELVVWKPVTGQHEAARALAQAISGPLEQHKTVLWLVSGGSSLPIAVEAAQLLTRPLDNLVVTLVDDVYGVEGTQTNWYKLKEQNFMAEGAEVYEIIGAASSLQVAGEQFAAFLEVKLVWADVVIGQFGLGAGYHTGGIQPGSQAAQEMEKLAIGYQDGAVERVTITPPLIERLDMAFINSLGKEKRLLIEHFLESTAMIGAEPTQALKRAKQTVLVSDVLPAKG